MTLSTYRNSPYWKAAIDLGPALARLADDLPGSEEVGLGKTLRHISVELPASIAADLISSTDTRQHVVLKLVAALELVDRVYPALDTAAARQSADALAEQLLAPGFGPEPAAPAPAEVEAAPVVPAAPVAPVSVPVAAEPTPVAVAAEPQLASPLGPAPQPVAVAPVQENHVQSDSQ